MEKLMRLCAVALAGAAMVCGQQPPLSPEVLQLSRIRERVLSTLARQPNYTCVETVERSHRTAATRKFQLLDIIRLEVALVDGKEMFGWPGSKKFEDTDLRNMVTTGAIGNGNFALHAHAIFAGNHATIKYSGVEPDAVRYDFRVPVFLSGYNLRTQAGEAIVGFHGSFWAHPDSLDLLRVEVIADDIPVRLGLAEATDRMDYSRMRIGEGEFLLPELSELTMVNLNGSESRNRVRFAGCRQFSGESVLTFGDAPASGQPAAPLQEIELPPDLTLNLALLGDVDVNLSAVGDPVRARLENDLRHKGQVLFSKGATVLGRVTRMERHENYIEVGLEFFEIESHSARAQLRAKLIEVVGADPLWKQPRRIGALAPKPGEGLIPLSTTRPRLMRGMLMFWRT
jgi:hypothetical protein